MNLDFANIIISVITLIVTTAVGLYIAKKNNDLSKELLKRQNLLPEIKELHSKLLSALSKFIKAVKTNELPQPAIVERLDMCGLRLVRFDSEIYKLITLMTNYWDLRFSNKDYSPEYNEQLVKARIEVLDKAEKVKVKVDKIWKEYFY